MFFRFRDDVVLELPDYLLSKMINKVSFLGFREESGGILLGSKDANSNRYLVTDFTFPSPEDERSPRYFIRKKDPSNEAIRRAWEESSGTVNYLGEWHTHDERMPSPSCIDKNLVGEVIADKSSPFADFFMLILGSGGGMFCGTAKTEGPGVFSDCDNAWWREIIV